MQMRDNMSVKDKIPDKKILSERVKRYVFRDPTSDHERLMYIHNGTEHDVYRG